MPPETRSALRRPRRPPGTGVGSNGMPLRYAPSGPLDQHEDLVDGAVDVVVGDNVVVPRGVGHLLLGDLAARLQFLVRLAAPVLTALRELLLRRRNDEDRDRFRDQAPYLLRPLHVDLQHHIAPCFAGVFDPVPEGPVHVAVVICVLEEGVLLDVVEELLPCQERVVLVGLLTLARLARGSRDRIDEVRVELEKALYDGVLADARRSRDDDEEPPSHVSELQNFWKSAGGAASKLISSPVRGWRRRSLQACSIGRARSGSPPP